MAAAMLGFPISVCRFLLHPGSKYHDAIVENLPDEIASQWREILKSKGEAVKLLESTRNRLDPFFMSPTLRLMFGVPESRFDCERLIRQRKIVIINLAEMSTVPTVICDTIGALFLNEIFQTANRMATTYGRNSVSPTYLILDEFQRYIGPDIESALPTVRQMGLRLILAHQSFSQLDRTDVDLTQMIWQARTRIAFANYGKDADSIADEFAKMTFNDMEIKDQRVAKRQLINGHRKEILDSWGTTNSSTSGVSQSQSKNEGESSGTQYSITEDDIRKTSTSTGRNSDQARTKPNQDPVAAVNRLALQSTWCLYTTPSTRSLTPRTDLSKSILCD